MTQPVTQVVCSHAGRAERSEPDEIVTLKDCRAEPWVSVWRRDETGRVYRDDPELRAEIVRIRGPMPSETGLPHRSGVTRKRPGDAPDFILRCPPCRINVEVSNATLGAALDALYPVIVADDDGERTVELAVVAAVVSRRHLLP